MITSNKSTALTDFNGQNNTKELIEQLKGVAGTNTTGCPSAEAANAYVFPNGKKGYLPAVGEFNIVASNIEKIREVMATIGGNTKLNETTGVSTLHSSHSDWYFQYGTTLKNGYKPQASKILPFMV